MKKKKIDKIGVLSALDCRAYFNPEDQKTYDKELPDCEKCRYCYDIGCCDLEQILMDAVDVLTELLRSKYCYTCKHYKDPDSCDHWLPCQVMKTNGLWHCADWSDLHD